KRRGWRLEKAAFSEEIAFSLFHAPISSSMRKFRPRERPRFDLRLNRLPAAAKIRRERFGLDHARWPWLLTRVGQRYAVGNESSIWRSTSRRKSRLSSSSEV